MKEPTHERDTRYMDEATTLLAKLADTDNWHLKAVEEFTACFLFDVVKSSNEQEASRMSPQDLQLQLDRMEDTLIQVSGYLSLCQYQKAIMPPYGHELDARLDQLGEIMQSIQVIKKAYDLPSKFQP